MERAPFRVVDRRSVQVSWDGREVIVRWIRDDGTPDTFTMTRPVAREVAGDIRGLLAVLDNLAAEARKKRVRCNST
jgi:hypothetical protein